jgi:3-phosphoshikimate 1-carboxyvinyltransferase
LKRLFIEPSKANGTILVPPSKSYTHRAIISASLAEGRSKIINPLIAEDTLATISLCKAFGSKIENRSKELIIDGLEKLATPDNILNVENSGTTLRIMTAVSTNIEKGFVIITGDESIRRRPMQPLLEALRLLGSECWSARLDGCAPIIIKGGGLEGGETQIRGDISSQFISGLIFASIKARKSTIINVLGRSVSTPYIDATLATLNRFGGEVSCNQEIYQIPPTQSLKSTVFSIPGDFSSTSFLLAVGAIAGGEVIVKGLDFSLPQADKKIIGILKEMGSDLKVDDSEGSISINGGIPLSGGDFDLSSSPDLLPVVMALALKCNQKTIVRGIEHARFKETDRISVIANEFQKMGVILEELKDGLIIEPSMSLKHCVLDAHGDHRLFMAFFLSSLNVPKGCTVIGAESVGVSYPSFIDDMRHLGVKVKQI